jgi:hypothetical protein
VGGEQCETPGKYPINEKEGKDFQCEEKIKKPTIFQQIERSLYNVAVKNDFTSVGGSGNFRPDSTFRDGREWIWIWLRLNRSYTGHVPAILFNCHPDISLNIKSIII